MHSNQQRPYLSRRLGFLRTGVTLGHLRISGSRIYVIVFLGIFTFLIGIVTTAIAYSTPYHRGVSHYLGPILLVGGGLLLVFGVFLCAFAARSARNISVGSEHASVTHPMMQSPEHIQAGGVCVVPQSYYPELEAYPNTDSPYQPTTEPLPRPVVYHTEGLSSKDESTLPLTAQHLDQSADDSRQYSTNSPPQQNKNPDMHI
ncbi:uncharacterized protein LOC111086006 [Limulus polyphemus]|uniref:Uncharacterized protein LOC111086006 n=1 Tax=Limulus polyphemus TaxID=6850 RepID=A0ABM1SGZ2_LIMPO|nr:uncharacterized protein LOC111086006 [Limulus polyphemus]XP_022242897.1 uncharacterized protein LOC111086006 [Limulus polyphemus]